MTSQSTPSPVPLTMGTHTWNPEDDKVDKIVEVMRKYKIKNLDTARIYNDGGSEKSIGVRKLWSEFKVDTKANTAVMPGTGRMITQFAEESLENLQTKKIRTYFLHGPDASVPFSEQVEDIQKLYLKGYFENFGLSNFSEEQVLEVYNYAKSKGYVLPSVYQSSYSPAVRRNEGDLFPTLRKLGFSIQSYSPMAGGLLAKSPEDIEAGKGSWDPSTPSGQIMRDAYYKPSYMKMLEAFGTLSKESGIARQALAYRWVRYHSILKAELGDEMIIGGTTAEQVVDSLAELEKGPLEPWVAERINEMWDIIKDDAPRDNLESARKVLGKLSSA